MIDEMFINGFCRTINEGRMVTVEFDDTATGKELLEVDCSYGKCDFEGACEVAKQIQGNF